MDNRKIGKLIASLRKKQGLTQQDLGDKVGVGFRAVSKWERGLTLPDITIINEVSKILGITSDELLKGEIDKSKEVKGKKKISTKFKMILLIAIILLMLIMVNLLYYSHRSYVYNIVNKDEKITLDGRVIFKNNKISILIHKLRFTDAELNSKIIKNYEYQISTGDEFIYGYGYSPTGETIRGTKTIEAICEKFEINYVGQIDSTRNEVLKNDIELKINFIDEKDEEITKIIKAKLYISDDKN